MNLETAIKYLAENTQEAEIYFLSETSTKIEAEGNNIRLGKQGTSQGYGIRVIYNNRLGFHYTQTLTREVLDRAIKIAKLSGEDENFCLPQAGNYPNVRGLFHREVAELEEEEASGIVKQMLDIAQELGVITTHAMLSWSTFTERIVNTNGVEAEQKGTAVYAYMSTVAGDKEKSTGFHWETARNMNIDFERVARTSGELAKAGVRAERIEKGSYSVLLKPIAVTELLEYALIPSFNAENVQRGRSRLKRGLKVGEITITDDPTRDGMLYSAVFDGEGKACERKILVQKGVVEEFLYDCYTARREGRESNGSAERSSHSSPPRIEASNFILSGMESSDLEAELVVHGLIGAHTSNPVTGDFSVEVRNAFLEGKPVKKAIISGNVFEMLEKIEALGKKPEQYSRVVTPEVLLSEIRVVT